MMRTTKTKTRWSAGYPYDAQNDAAVPLVTRKPESRPEPSQVVFDGDEDDEKMEEEQVANGQRPGEETVHVPYAHRDLKPG